MHSLLILCRIQNLAKKPKPKKQNLHIKICYITHQNPNPKSKIPRQSPKFGALGASHKWNCYITIQNPKSKSDRKSLDFGLGQFLTLDSVLDFEEAQPTLSDRVGARKQIELQKPAAQEVKTIFYMISRCLHACLGYCCNITIQIPNPSQLYLIELEKDSKLFCQNSKKRK